mmetsp:Transcript_24774/g.65028  ORF Transcript_24774/g.65028 Transcript_24774/m.65028 type:complete len:148 (-) Transcript_24774:81-524(-)
MAMPAGIPAPPSRAPPQEAETQPAESADDIFVRELGSAFLNPDFQLAMNSLLPHEEHESMPAGLPLKLEQALRDLAPLEETAPCDVDLAKFVAEMGIEPSEEELAALQKAPETAQTLRCELQEAMSQVDRLRQDSNGEVGDEACLAQ